MYFTNGSKLILAGADYADELRGQAADLILADQFSYVCELEVMWEAALLAMLVTTRRGRQLRSRDVATRIQHAWMAKVEFRVHRRGLDRRDLRRGSQGDDGSKCIAPGI